MSMLLRGVVLALFFSVQLSGCGSSSSTSDPPATQSRTGLTVAYGLSGTASNGAATLDWPAINGAISYRLYWAAGISLSKGTATSITLEKTQTTYRHTGLSNGTTYTYAYSVVDASGESELSSEVHVTPRVIAADAPANFKAIAGDRRVTLSWEGVVGATSYNVYFNTTGNVTTADHLVGHLNFPAVHVDLTNGQQYYYAVTAQTLTGESSLSAEVSAVPHSGPPDAPVQISVSAGDRQTVLSWSPVVGASSYALFWKKDGNVTLTDAVIANVMPPYTHSGLDNGSRYAYRVAAVNAQGPGALSAEVAAKPHPPAPGAPSYLKAFASNQQVTLNWEAVSGATQYNLYYTLPGQIMTVIPNVGASTSTSYTHTGLAGGVPITYQVSALRSGSEGPRSVELIVTPLGPLPSAPASITADAGHGQIRLNWQPVANAQSYNLYWSTNPDLSAAQKIAAVSLPYTHVGLTDSTTYYYALSAVTPDGESLRSAILMGSTLVPEVPINNGPPLPGPTLFSIGGSVSDLFGNGLSLALRNGNGSIGESISVMAGASSFAFNKQIAGADSYTITVVTQPANQTCTFGGNSSVSGTVGDSNVRVALSCIDTTPDAFVFIPQTNVAVSSVTTSNTITVTGINAPASISISGGEYSIGGTAFTTTAGTITNNQTVHVRQTSSPVPATTSTATLTIGGISGGFSVTTVPVDTTPDVFSLTAQTNVALSTQVLSNTITITGINSAAPISVSGGEYSINAGAFTTVAGTVNTGQAVQVRQTSSPVPATTSTVMLTIGGVSSGFNVTTVPADTVPGPFSFAAKIDTALSTPVISDPIIVTGINTGAPISVLPGGSYSIDNGAFTIANGTVTNDQSVRVSVTSSAAFNTTVSTTLSIGGLSSVFSATTLATDTTPDPFSFTAQTDAALSTVMTSNAITVAGINTPAPISVTSTDTWAAPQILINGVVATSVVSAGQSVQVRLTSAVTANTKTTATLTIGGISSDFVVTTLPAFTVTATAGTGIEGAIAPTSVSVIKGASTTFNVTAKSGYSIASVVGSPASTGCSSGTLSGITYITGPITADCTVTASFVATTYAVNVVVMGLTSGGLVVTKDTSDTQTISANGTFPFATPVPSGGTYTLTIITNPTGQTCLFANGTGVTTGDVSNVPVAVTCKANPAYTSKINDTGITANQCYQAGSDVLVECNSAGAIALNPAQDGMVGRDANVTANNNIDGKLGFSFSSVAGGCVQDNVTGLMWEVKTADGGLRDWNTTYTNYDSTTSAQKLDTVTGLYVNPTQAEIDAGTNSIGFKNAVNSQTLCGFSDWRLPTADELQSIVDYGVATPDPTVDMAWFPNTHGGRYWSASPLIGVSNSAWAVVFDYGFVDYGGGGGERTSSSYVRLVRIGQ